MRRHKEPAGSGGSFVGHRLLLPQAGEGIFQQLICLYVSIFCSGIGTESHELHLQKTGQSFRIFRGIQFAACDRLLRVAHAFAGILEHNQGALVQLNSVASIKNFPDLSTYSASKAASYSLTQGLYWTLKDKGVAVLSVHPGPIVTDMAADAGFDEGDSPETVAEGIVTALKAGEFHLFPDAMAKQFEAAYQSFSDNCVMVDFSE